MHGDVCMFRTIDVNDAHVADKAAMLSVIVQSSPQVPEERGRGRGQERERVQRERAAQDRGDGRGEGGQVVADQPVPLQHVLPEVQAHRRGDAPRGLHRGRRALDPRHPGHVRRLRVSGHARPLHLLRRRLHPRLRRHRRHHLRGGPRPPRSDPRDQGRHRRSHRRRRQQDRPSW